MINSTVIDMCSEVAVFSVEESQVVTSKCEYEESGILEYRSQVFGLGLILRVPA